MRFFINIINCNENKTYDYKKIKIHMLKCKTTFVTTKKLNKQYMKNWVKKGMLVKKMEENRKCVLLLNLFIFKLTSFFIVIMYPN